MSEQATPRGAVFLTAPPALAGQILADVRRRHPTVAWTVYYRASESAELDAALRGVDARSDKPAGSKLAFLRQLRAQRFDLAVIAWTGHHHYDRMKVVGLLCGARRAIAYDEHLEAFAVGGAGTAWLRHARWRPSLGGETSAWLVPLRAAYRWTLGSLLGGTWMLARLAWRRLQRARRPGAAPPQAPPDPSRAGRTA